MASSSQKVNMPTVETESNNVFVPHPTHEGHFHSMGMFIQPAPATIHIRDLKVSGFKIVTKEQDGLADQAKLLADDLLVAIDETFIDQKMLEAVQHLFKTRSVNFSMTLIRQDKPSASADMVKITIELVLGDTEIVKVHFLPIEPEVHFLFSQKIPSMVISQELKNLTRYFKATNHTTVTMETWHQKDNEQYLFDIYEYKQVTGDKLAITFHNAKYSGAITVSKPKEKKPVVLEPSNPSPPVGIVKPALNFFYIMSTGVTWEFGFEAVLISENYMTSKKKKGDLKLNPEKVSAADLPMKCRFLLTKSDKDSDDQGEDSLAASVFDV